MVQEMTQAQANGNDVPRPRRQKVASRRAQELLDAGEAVPGISTPSTPADDGGSPTHPAHPPLTSNMVPPKARAATATDTQARAERPEYHGAPIPSFTADTFAIYKWEVPRPVDFSDLSDRLKAWKLKVDQLEKQRNIDDGADDWHDFCGNRARYPRDECNGFALEHAIASTFKTRAKRAFWAGKKWSEFVYEERSITSDHFANVETDDKKRTILLEECLDDGLRMCVFDALKKRLCEEIWLEEYRETPDPVLAKVADRQTDSRASSPPVGKHRFLEPRREQFRAPTTTAEAKRGVAYWSIDGHQIKQPVYADEPGIPSGMSDFIIDMREQKHNEAVAALAAGEPRPGAGMPPGDPGGNVEFERPLNFSDSEGDDAPAEASSA